jgi:hypothetical protein
MHAIEILIRAMDNEISVKYRLAQAMRLIEKERKIQCGRHVKQNYRTWFRAIRDLGHDDCMELRHDLEFCPGLCLSWNAFS